MDSLATGSLSVRRRLGATGLDVCPLGLGTMQFGWTASDVMSMRVLDAYADAGGNLVDTANMYGGDQSLESFAASRVHVGVTEDIVGRWQESRGARDRIVLSTKVRARMWDGPDGEGLTRRHVERAVDDSLRRLRTDHVDVLYAHWPEPGDGDPEEWLETFGDLVRAGKVRYAGTSNFVDFAGQGDRLSPLLALAARDERFPAVAVEQPRYNLLNRAEYEATLQGIAEREGLGIVTYSSLASGFLAGAWRRDTPADSDRAGFVAQYRTEAGWALLDALDRMAADRDVTVAAVSLAWTLAQPGVTATLVGADAIPQLAACAPAVELRLEPAELDELTRLSWTASTPEFVGW